MPITSAPALWYIMFINPKTRLVSITVPPGARGTASICFPHSAKRPAPPPPPPPPRTHALSTRTRSALTNRRWYDTKRDQTTKQQRLRSDCAAQCRAGGRALSFVSFLFRPHT
ncbi:hypothetical protein PLESTB_001650400 [Pleodorina starrii]|uniref:Uncharacterized protein n=1 Tax=Pleodorina starrii TaxID=330485 RepID=A0A9W6C012_9CHLO|nr:hypothetical protein PLESTM_000870900 [Pleodorina starrii]GLC60636.1 hypothetical protein PLESTB_001650400 [Pleodorina starrii]GLC68893.1 hypothetical protein PLESTF_000755000 [Pleodorina starrii]